MQPKFKARAKIAVPAALMILATLIAPAANATQPSAPEIAALPPASFPACKEMPARYGIYDWRDVNFGTGLTECPQAGITGDDTEPLDLRQVDRVEQISRESKNRRTNPEFSCFPQDETSIAINPRNPRNLVGGANDYRLGWGTSGFYATSDGGRNWYTGLIPFPSLPTGDNLDAGGDPAIVFDRDGVVYYADINFNRTDDTNGVFVSRSTNGGFTWSRPCVAFGSPARCGGTGDPRQPGDGIVTFVQDDNTTLDGSVSTHDKEYIAAGPRPAGVSPVCFDPDHAARACDPAVVGVDRLYVTWTIFTDTDSKIYLSYSDDQARSWSAVTAISGSAPFCAFGNAPNACDFNQGSVPTVSPRTGHLYVAFENFNTPNENQYLVVRSKDGGQTFEGTFFVTPIFDINYPRAGGPSATRNRPDCTVRGQQAGRGVLTNSCFRVNSYGNITVDKRGGGFADDLYVVISDNRNGTPGSSNTDVFLFKSTDGGSSWVGPTRVNSDPSQLTGDRNSQTNTSVVGNDQWFPWVDISEQGDVNVVFFDRRLDTASTASEWPGSRSRPGNYLTWFWSAICTVKTANSRDCVAPEATTIPQPTAPFDPGPGPQPGQSQGTFPFKNFTLSDVPSNMDYSFRAGIFVGDYNNVAVRGNQAYGFWTDTRNGRSSKDQAGRNPACEQSDVFLQGYDAKQGGKVLSAKSTDSLFLVTLCPAQAVEKHDKHEHDR